MDLSWEPCIMKHGPCYDNPWDSQKTVKSIARLNRKRIPVELVDIKSGKVLRYDSFVEAGKFLGCVGSNVRRAMHKKMVLYKKYIVRLV